jgi:hypothetical protein
MPSIFSRLKGKDASKLKSKKGTAFDHLAEQQPPKPRWEDAFTRKTVEPEEIQDLIRRCTIELKQRGTTARSKPLCRCPYAAHRVLSHPC